MILGCSIFNENMRQEFSKIPSAGPACVKSIQHEWTDMYLGIVLSVVRFFNFFNLPTKVTKIK